MSHNHSDSYLQNHQHSPDQDHNHAHGVSEALSTAFFLNIGFTIIEFIGGLYINSLTILSDAVHDLGDSISLGLAWYLQGVSQKEKTKKFSYGYQRFSILGALINAFILLIGSFFILSEAIPRLLNPVQPLAGWMIPMAILGVVFNGAAVLRLKKEKSSSINADMVRLHLLEDALGWIAALIAAVVMYFFDLPILDPILSIALSLWLLWNTFKNLNKSVRIILQQTPSSINELAIKEAVCEHKAVASIHDIHLWTMDGQFHVFSAHIVLKEGSNFSESFLVEVKNELKSLIASFEIKHITLEFEWPQEECLEE